LGIFKCAIRAANYLNSRVPELKHLRSDIDVSEVLTASR